MRNMNVFLFLDCLFFFFEEKNIPFFSRERYSVYILEPPSRWDIVHIFILSKC